MQRHHSSDAEAPLFKQQPAQCKRHCYFTSLMNPGTAHTVLKASSGKSRTKRLPPFHRWPAERRSDVEKIYRAHLRVRPEGCQEVERDPCQWETQHKDDGQAPLVERVPGCLGSPRSPPTRSWGFQPEKQKQTFNKDARCVGVVSAMWVLQNVFPWGPARWVLGQ